MSFNDKMLSMKVITGCSDYLLLEPIIYWCKMFVQFINLFFGIHLFVFNFNKLDRIVLWSKHMLIKEYNVAWMYMCQVSVSTMFLKLVPERK